MITWRETCDECAGAGHRGGDWSIPGTFCKACDGAGHRPIGTAPGFNCETTLADREPGDVVILGTGDRARVQWHQPRKTKKVRPLQTFVSVFVDDFGESRESPERIPLPSSFGVRGVIVSRIAGEASEGRGGDLVDPLRRQALKRRGLL